MEYHCLSRYRDKFCDLHVYVYWHDYDNQQSMIKLVYIRYAPDYILDDGILKLNVLFSSVTQNTIMRIL